MSADGVVLGEPTFALVWPDATPTDPVRQALARLARADSVRRALVVRGARPSARHAHPARTGGAATSLRGLDEPGEPVRVPYAGFTDALRQAYADGRRAHLTTREVVYVAARPEPAPQGPVMSPFSELLIYAFEQPYAPIDGRHLVRVNLDAAQGGARTDLPEERGTTEAPA
ncbi:MAG: hypothetical protein KatS3mg010_1659 [Acidimicrobiia bacterium]|nr:MAG: hypothetical protein KatS3mg010_1659 [Acidimicrobiia bacterium]